MAFSDDTKIGDLLKSKVAAAILEEHFPEVFTNPKIHLAKGLALKSILGFPLSNITPDQLKACAEQLALIEYTVTGVNERITKGQLEFSESRLRWGIMAVGGMARKMAEAIVGTNGSELVAVASRSLDRAIAFSKEYEVQKVYGSYKELVDDPEVDIVYIANIHPQHFESAKLALNAGKAVLCEKPLTVNAKETEELITLARRNNVFLMEALWMRYNPNLNKLKEWISEGRIGRVKVIEADFSIDALNSSKHTSLELGGGALLDLGIYTISFANWIVGRFPDSISSESKLASTGVDEIDHVTFNWNTGEKAKLSFGIHDFGTLSAKVIGTDGYIEVHPPFHCPYMTTLHNSKGSEEYNVPLKINGYEYEVEEVMRCLQDGLKESPVIPLEETLETMKLMDSLRTQWGVVYPFEK